MAKKETTKKSAEAKKPAAKKSTKKVEATPVVKDVVEPKPVVKKKRLKRYNPPRFITAKQYLAKVKTKPQHIAPLVAAATAKGHTLATVSQWKEIFSKI